MSFSLYLLKNVLFNKPQTENLSKLLCEITKNYINAKYKLKMSNTLTKVYNLGLALNIIEENGFPISECVEPFGDIILHEELLFNVEEIHRDILSFLQILKIIKNSGEEIIEITN